MKYHEWQINFFSIILKLTLKVSLDMTEISILFISTVSIYLQIIDSDPCKWYRSCWFRRENNDYTVQYIYQSSYLKTY
jgi:hypothetical protein